MFAGIILLAHSFIPHIHHQDHICLINSACYTRNTDNIANSDLNFKGCTMHCDHMHSGLDDHDHHDDTHSNTNECKLNEIFVYARDGQKPIIKCNCQDGNHGHSLLSQLILPDNFVPAVTAWYNYPFREKPYVMNLPGHFPGRIQSMRAPPAC